MPKLILLPFFLECSRGDADSFMKQSCFMTQKWKSEVGWGAAENRGGIISSNFYLGLIVQNLTVVVNP